MRNGTRIFAFLLIAVVVSSLWNVASGAERNSQPGKPQFSDRLLVTFKQQFIGQIEAGLPEGVITDASARASATTHQFFQRHRLKRMRPLFRDQVQARRHLGRGSKQQADAIRARFAKRSKRFEGVFNPPDLSRTYVVTVKANSAGELDQAVAQLRREPQVESVQIDYPYHADVVPNDTQYSQQYGPKKISAEAAWDINKGEGVVIAISDSGIDYTHPDIAANMWHDPNTNAVGYDFSNDDTDPRDDNGHGTHVAGIAAAVTNNTQGVAGLAWNAKLMAVKGLDADGSGYTSALAQTITHAASNGADIINMSWSGPNANDPILINALQFAHQLGVVLVAAAGNQSVDALTRQPACSPYVITVAATDQNDNPASFSNYGLKIDVAAPGVSILSLKAANTPAWLRRMWRGLPR
jgi:subtilisin family serine protease